jgi:hypothetical protein
MSLPPLKWREMLSAGRAMQVRLGLSLVAVRRLCCRVCLAVAAVLLPCLLGCCRCFKALRARSFWGAPGCRTMPSRHDLSIARVPRRQRCEGLSLHSDYPPPGLQSCSGSCMSLGGGEVEPSDGLCSVLRNIATIMKHVAQVTLSDCIPLCCCKAEPSFSLCIVLRNALTVTKHVAQVDLSGCMPLLCCEARKASALSNTTTPKPR